MAPCEDMNPQLITNVTNFGPFCHNIVPKVTFPAYLLKEEEKQTDSEARTRHSREKCTKYNCIA